MGFLPTWKEKIDDDIVWPSWYLRLSKYKPFVNQSNIQKCEEILKERIKEYA
jgi:hypothetical protein